MGYMEVGRRRSKSFLKKIQKEQSKKCFLCNVPATEIIFETKELVVILDAFPAVKGHVLIAPKKHYFSLSEISNPEVQNLTLLTQKLDKVLRKLFNPFRVAILSTGVAVQHFHFHVVPIPNEEMAWDFKFLMKSKILKYSKPEISLLKRNIREMLTSS